MKFPARERVAAGRSPTVRPSAAYARTMLTLHKQAAFEGCSEEQLRCLGDNFGVGPYAKPYVPNYRECPKCHEKKARVKEVHADTGMDDFELKCDACGQWSDIEREKSAAKKDPKFAPHIGFDLDGTLAKTTGKFSLQVIGAPIPKMIKKLKQHLKDGDEVRIFTARAASKGAVGPIHAWLEDLGLPKLKVTNKKTPGMRRLYDNIAVSVKTDEGTTKEASRKKEIQALLDDSDIPADVYFYTDGKERATVCLGDWHESTDADIALQFGRANWEQWEDPDDSEIGKPSWATTTMSKRREKSANLSLLDSVAQLADIVLWKRASIAPQDLRYWDDVNNAVTKKISALTPEEQAQAAVGQVSVTGSCGHPIRQGNNGVTVDIGKECFTCVQANAPLLKAGSVLELFGGVELEKLALRPIGERMKRLRDRRGECYTCAKPNRDGLVCDCGETKEWTRDEVMAKSASEMKRKTVMVPQHTDHCPHCDFEFREKCYTRMKRDGKDVDDRRAAYDSGDYDEHCPECDGIIDQKEQSDEEINDPFLSFPGSKEKALARREAQRKRKAAREVEKSASSMGGAMAIGGGGGALVGALATLLEEKPTLRQALHNALVGAVGGAAIGGAVKSMDSDTPAPAAPAAPQAVAEAPKAVEKPSDPTQMSLPIAALSGIVPGVGPAIHGGVSQGAGQAVASGLASFLPSAAIAIPAHKRMLEAAEKGIHAPVSGKVRLAMGLAAILGSVGAAAGGNKLRESEKAAAIAAHIRRARNVTHTDPTPAQAHEGNYRKGEFTMHGMTIKLENPKGSTRRGYKDGKEIWARVMQADYGYFKGTEAVDGDAIDCFVGPNPDSEMVVAIDQYRGDNFDETKFVLGVDSQDEGTKLYLAHYPKGWRLGPVSTTTVQQLKEWLKAGKHKVPFKGQLVKAATVGWIG